VLFRAKLGELSGFTHLDAPTIAFHLVNEIAMKKVLEKAWSVTSKDAWSLSSQLCPNCKLFLWASQNQEMTK